LTITFAALSVVLLAVMAAAVYLLARRIRTLRSALHAADARAREISR